MRIRLELMEEKNLRLHPSFPPILSLLTCFVSEDVLEFAREREDHFNFATIDVLSE
jgi:hypothetical protein